MQHAQDTEQRLTDLEIKASFSEDLLDQLNQVIVHQQQQIDALLREVSQLRRSLMDTAVGAPANALQDLPPHY